MKYHNSSTGQWIDSRDHNDNAPPRYTAPSSSFKKMLAGFANPYCQRCSGTGYLGRFKHICAGRCFKCISENEWAQAEKEMDQARYGNEEMIEIYHACGDGGAGQAYLCDGIWITSDGGIYDESDSWNLSREPRAAAQSI